jgi:hypothetical protein
MQVTTHETPPSHSLMLNTFTHMWYASFPGWRVWRPMIKIKVETNTKAA